MFFKVQKILSKMSVNFLSVLNESNSITNEETGEITITAPILETTNSFLIETECKITSNCQTKIKCVYFEIIASSVTLNNLIFETTFLAQETEKLSITNCEFIEAKSGLGALTISFCADVTLSHIDITNSAKMPGLYICQYSSAKADNLHIHDIPYTLLALDGASKLILKDSEFRNSKNNGIHVSDQCNVDIQNCEISDTVYPAISINDSQCIIKNNTVRNVGQNSISIFSSENFIVSNNSVENGGATAISTEKSEGLIENNLIQKVHGNGIHVSNNANVKIIDNEINDADYPGIAVVSNATAHVERCKINNIKINGICSRGAKDVKIIESEIIGVEECGVSISDTKHLLISNSRIENCKIMAIESYNNSQVFVSKNIIKNIGKYVFLSYTHGFISAEENKIEDVKNAMVKLVHKGGGSFVNNNVVNCPCQCECQTSSPYFFKGNGNFEAITNDPEKVEGDVKLAQNYVQSNLLCMKCNKNERNCFLLECGHKVYCKECAEEALNNKEKCPLCRFNIEKVSVGFETSDNDNCTICFENKSDCILLPCGHMGVCSSCLEDHFKHKKSCPFCRTEPCFYKKIINDL